MGISDDRTSVRGPATDVRHTSTKGVWPMSVPPLTSVRARGVESHLQARVERLKIRPQPLGICRSCQAFVYSGDSLAMAGGFLFHGDCPTSAAAAKTA
jgi:hypothetical protein